MPGRSRTLPFVVVMVLLIIGLFWFVSRKYVTVIGPLQSGGSEG